MFKLSGGVRRCVARGQNGNISDNKRHSCGVFFLHLQRQR